MSTKLGKRSPLKENPLRNPGQSLEEEIEQVRDDQLLPRVMVASFAVAFAAYEWARSLLDIPPQPVAMTFLALATGVYALHRFPKGLQHLRLLRQGLDGERFVGQYLEAYRREGWHVLHDIPGKGFNVDHVIIAPQGIFVVETKTYSKPTRGKATAQFDGKRLLVNGFAPERDPVGQARAVRDWVRDLLVDTTGKRYPVRGVVLLPEWYVEGPKEKKSSDIWVLNHKALIPFIQHEDAPLSNEDVALVHSRLRNHVTRRW